MAPRDQKTDPEETTYSKNVRGRLVSLYMLDPHPNSIVGRWVSLPRVSNCKRHLLGYYVVLSNTILNQT